MMTADNHESYETVSWILDNADMGFFIVTAPHRMQLALAERYQTDRVAIYDYAHNSNSSSFSYSELSAWADSHGAADFYFILNMQLALRSEADMLSLNLYRDMLAKKHKAWLFFMDKDLDDRLSTFAFDFYSYVRQKARFLPEEEEVLAPQRNTDFEKPVNLNQAREALARYRDIEEQLISLPLDDTPDNQLLSAATTLSNIADLYSNCADYVNALRLLDIARTIRERIKGTWHPDTAAVYNDIARVYNLMGEYPKALELYQKALEICKKALGEEHSNTAATYNNIALVYNNLGDYAKAMEFYQKDLEISEKTWGKDHPNIATTYNNIALVYNNLGDYAKALEWYDKALTIRERILGKDHPSTANTYNNIAVAYNNQGAYTKALEWHNKALATREKTLGKEYPDTADTYSNIAVVYENQGDYAKARDWYEKALAITEKTLGRDHLPTIGGEAQS